MFLCCIKTEMFNSPHVNAERIASCTMPSAREFTKNFVRHLKSLIAGHVFFNCDEMS